MNSFDSVTGTVLVVDDNYANLEVLGKQLQENNLEIEFATDGETALKWIDSQQFDLVLLDVNMPGLSGFDVCKILKANPKHADLPIIFITANNDIDSIVKAFDIGAIDFIAKPFINKEVVTRVKTQIQIKKHKDAIDSYINEIEQKNFLIDQSIRYAERIQSVVISNQAKLENYFSDYFVSIIPLSVLCGDFFWTHAYDEKIMVGTFDCTGHGIPGALMSILTYSMLHEIVSQNNSGIGTDQILNQLRTNISKVLYHHIDKRTLSDGADGTIISFDLKKSVASFSGAYSRAYLIRENQITEFKGDNMPIAMFSRMDPFKVIEIELKKDDVFYLMTDGLIDQFGGELNKKLGRKRVIELLLEIHKMPMSEQKNIITKTFVDWKGDQDQIDDTTIAGLKI